MSSSAPVNTTGKSDTPLRGDYSAMAADYTVPQGWERITAEEHARWRTLYERQSALLPRYAAPEFMESLAPLDARDGVPHFDRASELLNKATGWTLVAVPGLLPNDVFFNHLAEKRFPVTNWIRRADEMDYLVEPDVFHDFFGHVPLLMHPVFADYLQAYGRKGAEAEAHGGLERLARLYWYMVEFGLISTPQGLRAYGAGMLSSRGETQYCIESPEPNRVGFNLERVMRTHYRIDDYQETYFVLDSFEQLFQATAQDFAPLYAKLASLPDLPADQIQPGDTVFTAGRKAA
ncbi:phenylalanine 4-hydroxylase [Nitrospirillum amazonense]|uniref:Phenylalanine-4-hydroxylase n=1 Tax=Nitrospirillum amazonense TaxID=28077 RepID=A0A560FAR4_9PROT|nr:phenylalanine 4-monooxygenase [Nitrospirillum amazonense]TWB18645.1 phenylalanine 4-hydroxylase [Nitrospirillum amazonense]